MKLQLFALTLCAAIVGAAASPLHFPDRNGAAVVDAAHLLSVADRDALNREVVAWDKATGHQLAIATVPSLEGADIKDYGYQLGRAWGLGDKQRNDGAILLLAPHERKVRIEVGYGLEPTLTDALTSAIIHDRIVPRLREDAYAIALKDGAEAIMQMATQSDVPAPVVAQKAKGGLGLPAALVLLCLFIGSIAAALAFWRTRAGRQPLGIAAHDAGDDGSPVAIATAGLGSEIAALGGAAAASASASRTRSQPLPPRRSMPVAPPPVMVVETARSRDDDWSRSSFASCASDSSSSPSSSSDSSSSFSSDTSSSSFDSGGGSFGGGGSDSSY